MNAENYSLESDFNYQQCWLLSIQPAREKYQNQQQEQYRSLEASWRLMSNWLTNQSTNTEYWWAGRQCHINSTSPQKLRLQVNESVTCGPIKKFWKKNTWQPIRMHCLSLPPNGPIRTFLDLNENKTSDWKWANQKTFFRNSIEKLALYKKKSQPPTPIKILHKY